MTVKVMGIVNVTPDSFSDGGRWASADRAADHAMRLVQQGADVLDIGGESTRPGADPVEAAEEIDRVVGFEVGADHRHVPQHHHEPLRAVLDALGDGEQVERVRVLGGGDGLAELVLGEDAGGD